MRPKLPRRGRGTVLWFSTVVGLLLAAIFVAGTAGGQSGDERFRVGEPFPDLVFPSLADGRPSSLAAYRGKKIILHVFASW